MTNPLLSKFNTPYNTPPFNKIGINHYKPALKKAIGIARNEVMSIINNLEKPSFENTIEALEKSGSEINRIAGIFFNLNEAETNEAMQKLAPELSEMLTDFANEVNLSSQLFERVKDVYHQNANLNDEKQMLLNNTYKGFVRGGADLNAKKKKRFREITRRLSSLGLKFNENILAETNDYELHITDENNLAGLPDYAKNAAKEEAIQRNKNGWVFTLHYPSYVPFMQHANNRKLREQMYKAFSSRCNKGNEYDNKEVIREIINLRLEKARLLGYKTYANFILEERMAENPENVKKLLDNLYQVGHPFALKDKEAVEKIAKEEGCNKTIEKWDWAYYSEKLKQKKYNLTDEITKPYFLLNNVINAIFDLSSKLYNIEFKHNTNIPTYHNDVNAFEVRKIGDRNLKAVFYCDFHPRKGKRQGAWMTTFREQSKCNGVHEAPFVSIVMNFTKPTKEVPALLTFDEVTTFLHEFGHALHAILSNVNYRSLSCTNVFRDFVELPSQVLENWAYEKEWLSGWANHYKNGKVIPNNLIQRICDAKNFNAGYMSDRQISFGLIDLALHTLTSKFEKDIIEFEQQIISKAELLPTVEGSAFLTTFGHIFGGGYAAGYYGYKWAEVLDADAFEFFLEKGIFNKEVAALFETNILTKGGTSHPMKLYTKFRGKEPSIEPLLKRSGMI